MPVDFRFSKLSIWNFRGVRELDLDLPQQMPVHLIGGNNSGKSTVLEAMALVFKGGDVGANRAHHRGHDGPGRGLEGLR